MNFQMFKLVLENAEEPEIKLPISAGSWKKQESSRKTSISALLTMPKPLTVWITRNWKILKEMGIPDHLTYFLRNLCAGQEATVRTGHGRADWFQIGKEVHQGCILSPCLFNFYAEYIMRNAGLEEAQAGVKIARRNINNLRCTDDTALRIESEEELRSLLMKVKEESEKYWMVGWHHQLTGHEFAHTGRQWRTGKPGHAAVHGVAKSQKWLNDWRTTASHCGWELMREVKTGIILLHEVWPLQFRKVLFFTISPSIPFTGKEGAVEGKRTQKRNEFRNERRKASI